MSSDGKPRFNSIFGQFTDVEENDRIPGLIAYGLYKTAKREWAAGIWDREHRPPNESELAGYERTWTASQIDGKRDQARNILSVYADDVVEAAAPAIEKEALRGSGVRVILYGLLTSLIYTLILLGVALGAKYAGIDLLGIVTKVGR